MSTPDYIPQPEDLGPFNLEDTIAEIEAERAADVAARQAAAPAPFDLDAELNAMGYPQPPRDENWRVIRDDELNGNTASSEPVTEELPVITRNQFDPPTIPIVIRDAAGRTPAERNDPSKLQVLDLSAAADVVPQAQTGWRASLDTARERVGEAADNVANRVGTAYGRGKDALGSPEVKDVLRSGGDAALRAAGIQHKEDGGYRVMPVRGTGVAARAALHPMGVAADAAAQGARAAIDRAREHNMLPPTVEKAVDFVDENPRAVRAARTVGRWAVGRLRRSQ